jgi:hypothetical protein
VKLDASIQALLEKSVPKALPVGPVSKNAKFKLDTRANKSGRNVGKQEHVFLNFVKPATVNDTQWVAEVALRGRSEELHIHTIGDQSALFSWHPPISRQVVVLSLRLHNDQIRPRDIGGDGSVGVPTHH